MIQLILLGWLAIDYDMLCIGISFFPSLHTSVSRHNGWETLL